MATSAVLQVVHKLINASIEIFCIGISAFIAVAPHLHLLPLATHLKSKDDGTC